MRLFHLLSLINQGAVYRKRRFSYEKVALLAAASMVDYGFLYAVVCMICDSFCEWVAWVSAGV